MTPAQTPARSVVGTVSAFKAETAEIEIKTDAGAVAAFKVTADTAAQRVAPGVTDLKQAQSIQVTEVMLGDRVLATPEAGTSNLRRIVVMSAGEIEKRNAADKADWSKRGVAGVVASKSGSEITLKIRTMTGEQQAVVTVTEKTTFKRYAPDSVKFADARNSKLSEIAAGDQVRARGQKSEDGLKVTAEDVVFGTFVTKAGSVVAINTEAREISVKDLSNNKPLTIRFTADSQMKKMPDFAGMMGRGGMPGGGMPGRGAAPGGGMAGRGPMGGMDINAMLERMPQAKLEDLKPGEMIVVSSTKGAKNDQVTAIMMLANADFLLQMAAAQAGGGAARGGGMGGGMGGMMGGGGMDALGGMGLGGIIP